MMNVLTVLALAAPWTMIVCAIWALVRHFRKQRKGDKTND